MGQKIKLITEFEKHPNDHVLQVTK